MNRYERRLPHWDSIGHMMFVTFRLRDSLPANRAFPPEKITGGKAFVLMDRMLDHARTGPVYLRQPEIAEMVVGAVHAGEVQFGRYELHSFVVMPNHVHLLITPRTPSRVWLRSLKGFTGHEANRIMNTPGRPFWQEESYDHLVRNNDEACRIQRYIERNPVQASFVDTPEAFPWSSAAPGGSPAARLKP